MKQTEEIKKDVTTSEEITLTPVMEERLKIFRDKLAKEYVNYLVQDPDDPRVGILARDLLEYFLRSSMLAVRKEKIEEIGESDKLHEFYDSIYHSKAQYTFSGFFNQIKSIINSLKEDK